MKLAIFSDVHANLEALEGVLADMTSRGVTRQFCLGDVVGYGPSPNEVCARIQQLGIETLQGNHDEEVSRERYPYRCNAVAAISILWTRSVMSSKNRRWLSSLPQQQVLPELHLTLSHANGHAPATWEYITNPNEAHATLRQQQTRLAFIGHTHEPAVYVLGANGRVRSLGLEDFTLHPDCRYLVNVGSVGQSRDGDPRSCYALYDTEAQRVGFVRTPYTLATTRQKLLEAQLPQILAARLTAGI